MQVNQIRRYFYSIATLFLVMMVTNHLLGYNVLKAGNLTARSESAEQAVMAESMELGRWSLPDIGSWKNKELSDVIEKKSLEFVITAFLHDSEKMERLLARGTTYVLLPEGDSYIRYIDKEQHVEGYMATNKRLLKVKHKWYVEGEKGTVTSGIELLLMDEKAPQTWFLHFRKVFSHWKVFMLENGI